MKVAGELFFNQVRQAQSLDLGIVTMPSYSEPQMNNLEANSAPWETFKSKMRPLSVVDSQVTNIEYLLTPKDVGWGVEDVNLFAGEEGREINEISDLSVTEGEEFFVLNFALAQRLIQDSRIESVLVAIGFNPHDFSVGHHSIRRLHSHVRTMPHKADMTRRKQYTWQQLERFDRLAFIEPFADLHHDFITDKVREGLFQGQLLRGPERRLGYTSIVFAPENMPGIFSDLQLLYVSMRDEYETIAAIFTDGKKDEHLDRYLPLPLNERQQRLANFLLTRNGLYSERSRNALEYLSERLVPAEARAVSDPRDMSTAGKIYITRGFAGAINFTFDRRQEGVQMDFLPRVITTSGITKTIMGDTLPSVIAKTKSPANSEERGITARYHERVRNALDIIRCAGSVAV